MKRKAFTGFVLVLMFTVGVVISQKIYTYDDDIKPVFNTYCVECHSFTGVYENLMAQKSDDNPIVVPESADESVLIWRLEGKTSTGASIIQMPFGGDPLSEDTITMFRDWIEQGAIECCPTVDVQSHTWSQVKNNYKE